MRRSVFLLASPLRAKEVAETFPGWAGAILINRQMYDRPESSDHAQDYSMESERARF
jgi:hypothetical protein